MATGAGDGSQKNPGEEVLGVGNDGEETCSARDPQFESLKTDCLTLETPLAN